MSVFLEAWPNYTILFLIEHLSNDRVLFPPPERLRLNEQFQDYQISYHFQRVLQEIQFSSDFTSTALGAFLHLTTTKSSVGRRVSNKLKVFLSYASQDRPVVQEFYRQLKSEGWIDPWLDEEKIFPGQDWNMEIERAIDETDAVIVFVSSNSVNKEGYLQYELRVIFNMAKYKPDETLFILPIRLDETPMPRQFGSWQFVDAFPEDRKNWAYERLLASLKLRAEKLDVDFSSVVIETAKVKGKQAIEAAKAGLPKKQSN
ncbi:MAG: toll/interleukin-1 receptor domain-containing protein [Anaerolineae bacterium]|nr:toll/interleukin-1 receptor domain-containing protein [Anaerolineae bacterium]